MKGELNMVNRKTAIVFLLVLAATCLGRTLLVLAAGGGPVAYRFSARAPDPNCIVHQADMNNLPFPIDVSQVVGTLLPPITAQAGKWSHVFRPCDPEGDAFEVVLQQAPLSFGLTPDDVNGALVLSGDLPKNVNYFYFRMVDIPGTVTDPCEIVYTLAVKGTPRKNRPVVLY